MVGFVGNLFGNRDEDDKSKVPNDSRTRYYYEFEEVTVSTTTPGKAETTSTKSNNEWVPISVQAALPTTDNRKEKSYEGKLCFPELRIKIDPKGTFFAIVIECVLC